MKRTMYLLGMLLVAGCTPPLTTPSGQPEMTVPNVDAACIRNTVLNGLIDQGYQIRTTNDNQIIAGRVSENLAMNLFFSTGFSGNPEERVTIMFIPQPTTKALRIVVTRAIVSNQGTAFEKVHPIQGTVDDQRQMKEMRRRIISGRGGCSERPGLLRTSGDSTLQVSLSSVQAKLTYWGYYAGPLDGAMSRNLRSAIKRYQADSGIPATGDLDDSTLAKLGISE